MPRRKGRWAGWENYGSEGKTVNLSAPSARAAAGQKARNVGELFEEALEAYHTQLAAEGKAHVLRVGPRVKWVNYDGNARPVAVGKGPPDFMGALSDGTPIAFDAKTTGHKESFTLKRDEGSHQLAVMAKLHEITEGRAIVGWLVWWRQADEYRFHPVTAETTTLTQRRSEGVLVGYADDGLRWFNEVSLYTDGTNDPI